MSPSPYDPPAAELDRLRAGLRIMALGALRDSDAADEVAQETLVRVTQALREGRLEDHLKLVAYARGVARHVIVDTLRAKKHVVALDRSNDPEPASSEDALGALVSEEQVTRVRATLEALSATDREILRLSYFDGLTPLELSARLGEPAPRIRKRKERALERLRRAFLAETSHESGPRTTHQADAKPIVARPGGRRSD